MKTKTNNIISMGAFGFIAGFTVGLLGGSETDIAFMVLAGIVVVGFSKAGVI